MFEKEAKEYRRIHGITGGCDTVFKDGAEFGYNKANEQLTKATEIIKQLSKAKEQIEKMKCGGNCKHLYHVNTGGCYDAKCDLTYCDCTNCKDEWELRS